MAAAVGRLTPLALAIAAQALGVTLSAENWPHWRGPSGTGTSSETRLPEKWSDEQNIAWRTRLGGSGVSSPVVWGDRVFVISQSGAGVFRAGPRLGQGGEATTGERPLERTGGDPRAVQFVVEALNRADGRRLWTRTIAAEGELPSVHDKHNLTSASPVTDGERVYAVFGTGQIAAIDHTGTLVWTRNLAKEFGAWDINWGNGSSPTLHRGLLILSCYHGGASYLLALDSRTGKQAWKTDRPRGVLSYSTPIVVPGSRGDEVIVNSSVGVEAYDPATGKPLWHVDEANQFPIPVAMHHDGVIYLSRGYRSGPYAAIRTGGRGDVSKTHVVWHVPTGAPYISSLVHYDGLLYMAGDVGVITCVDARTGERVWRERLGGVYTASPVAGDGKIYLLSETGETIVLRAGRKPDVLARNRIDGRILASPAISEGRLFVRTDDHVVAIGGTR
jgi:outer membrane protein assembly factor BamB